MAGRVPSTELSGRDSALMDSRDSPPQSLSVNHSQMWCDQIAPAPADSETWHPNRSQTSLHNTQILQEAIMEDWEERVALLPSEDRRTSTAEASYNSNHHPPPSQVERNVPKDSGVTLPRSSYIVRMVFIYPSLALTVWILICILTFKPPTAKRYGFDTREQDISRLQARFIKSEEIYRAARTVQQPVVGVLTIPLTSAVCSAAAIVFAQAKTQQRKLTLCQTMTLADKVGWTDPTRIDKLLSGRGKQLSSSLLMGALLLNLLGACLTPLQTILLTRETIKTPTLPQSDRMEMSRIVDIPDKFDITDPNQPSLATILTRNALESTSNKTHQPRLWQEDIGRSSSNGSRTERCVLETISLGNFSALSAPFLAQLPVGYHAGVIKQYILRINSTVRWETLPRADMHVGCGEMPNFFYVHYANAILPSEASLGYIGGQSSNWSIQACMPGNQSMAAWHDTYRRQDFTEVFYLDMSVMGHEDDFIQHKASILLPLAVCSIVGFFETKANDAVDELPGSIGDATGHESDVGALDLGAFSPLRAARRYSCHSDDRENFER